MQSFLLCRGLGSVMCWYRDQHLRVTVPFYTELLSNLQDDIFLAPFSLQPCMCTYGICSCCQVWSRYFPFSCLVYTPKDVFRVKTEERELAWKKGTELSGCTYLFALTLESLTKRNLYQISQFCVCLGLPGKVSCK